MAVDVHTPEYARAIEENDRYAKQFDRSSLPLPFGRRLAVVACMDARLTVEDVLGLRTGDAHIIRNAGGLATDDAIRSLVISQNLLGTEEVIVIEHTGCGMLTFQDGGGGPTRPTAGGEAAVAGPRSIPRRSGLPWWRQRSRALRSGPGACSAIRSAGTSGRLTRLVAELPRRCHTGSPGDRPGTGSAPR